MASIDWSELQMGAFFCISDFSHSPRISEDHAKNQRYIGSRLTYSSYNS